MAPPKPKSYWIHGIHPVKAVLNNPARIVEKLLVTKPLPNEFCQRRIHFDVVSPEEIERQLSPGAVHQGIAAQVLPLPCVSLEDVMANASDTSILVLLDQVTDPHNLGAIIRSAAAFGADAVITTDRHTADITGVVAKSASGALEEIPLIQVTNLVQTMGALKENNFWCYGLDERGDTLSANTFTTRTALVFGAEGKGLRLLTSKTCDGLIRLPTTDTFSTLNVSTSVAVTLFACRQSMQTISI